jgi:hypothetical protein
MVSLILGLQRYAIETKIKKKFKKIFSTAFWAAASRPKSKQKPV